MESAPATEHRAAATTRTAEAGVGALRRPGVWLAELEIVVVGQFFARTNVAAAVDEDTLVLVDDLAVRRAGMIDPPRGIAPSGGIDDKLIVDFEEHRMRRMLVCLGIAFIGFLLRNSFALVLDDTCMFWDPCERKNAPTMNRRVANGKTTVNLLHPSCIAHEIKRINSCGRNGGIRPRGRARCRVKGPEPRA
jgi:hypothetical protein